MWPLSFRPRQQQQLLLLLLLLRLLAPILALLLLTHSVSSLSYASDITPSRSHYTCVRGRLPRTTDLCAKRRKGWTTPSSRTGGSSSSNSLGPDDENDFFDMLNEDTDWYAEPRRRHFIEDKDDFQTLLDEAYSIHDADDESVGQDDDDSFGTLRLSSIGESALEIEGSLTDFRGAAVLSDDTPYDKEADDDDDDDEELDADEASWESHKLRSFDAAATTLTVLPGLDILWVGAVASNIQVMCHHHLRDYGVTLAVNFDDFVHTDHSSSTAAELARFLYQATGIPAITEQTLLTVDALRERGARLLPRAAAAYRVDRVDARAEKLLARLAAVSPPDRKARFVSTAAFYDGHIEETASAEVVSDLRLATVATAIISRAEAVQRLTSTLADKHAMFHFDYYENRQERYYTREALDLGAGRERLREKLREQARVLPNGDVDVSSFIGSSVDVNLLDECAAELVETLGEDLIATVTKILTTGSSGQQLALPIARLLNVRLVCARREQRAPDAYTSPLGRVAYADSIEVTYQSKHYGPGQQLFIPRDAFQPSDNVLVVDDFLASGSCQEAMLRLTTRAGAHPVALAVLIEKRYERARDFLAGYDIPIVSLASIVSVANDYITLDTDDAYLENDELTPIVSRQTAHYDDDT